MGWRDHVNTDLRAVWRQASTWVLGALLFAGDVYNEAASLIGYADIPSNAKHVMYAFAVAGLAAKHWRQKAPASKDAA